MDFTKLRDFLDYMAANLNPGCAITVYYKNEKAFEYAAGLRSIETGEKLVGDELFNIYSCSKIMTVTAALTLFERGIYLMNDPLSEYIPEFDKMKIRQPDGSLVDAKRKITVGDLFSMSAGMNYNLNSPSIARARELTGGKMDTPTVVRCLAGEPLSFEPGTRWQYSLCHDVLAGLVAILTGKPFREYVREAILEPLGMTETVYHHTPETLARTAEQYQFRPSAQKTSDDIVEMQKSGRGFAGEFVNVGKGVSHILGPEYDSGGAGITTSCGDYAKLIAALANNGLGLTGERILSSKTVELMKTNRLNERQLADFCWNQLAGYGYGLGVRTHIDRAKSGSNASLGEFGWGGAAGATAIIDSDLGLGAFLVQHTLNPREEWYQPRLRNVIYSCI